MGRSVSIENRKVFGRKLYGFPGRTQMALFGPAFGGPNNANFWTFDLIRQAVESVAGARSDEALITFLLDFYTDPAGRELAALAAKCERGPHAADT